MTWRSHAACLGMDTETFYPGPGTVPAAARAACARCPVTADCLEEGLRLSEGIGIWGAKTGNERHAIQVEREGRECETCGARFINRRGLSQHRSAAHRPRSA